MDRVYHPCGFVKPPKGAIGNYIQWGAKQQGTQERGVGGGEARPRAIPCDIDTPYRVVLHTYEVWMDHGPGDLLIRLDQASDGVSVYQTADGMSPFSSTQREVQSSAF